MSWKNPFSRIPTAFSTELLLDDDNNIEVTILEIKGDQVKIGIAAPKEVPVYRKEVYLQIQNANQEATDSSGMAALKDLLG